MVEEKATSSMQSRMNTTAYREEQHFSIMLGGPFFQLLRKIHLTNDTLNLLIKRLIILTALAWLPLLILSILQGVAWGGKADLVFIEDIEVHVRYLVALPMLVGAEMLVHERIMVIVRQFQERKLIPQEFIQRYHAIIDAAFRLRNSYLAEIAIVVIIYFIGYRVVWSQAAAVETTAWHNEPAVGTGNLSLAGIWFRYISLPFFQFLLLRWYYRIFIWVRFLFQVSRLPLQLIPSHPDGVGGLGFLSTNVIAFTPLAIAHGSIMAGTIANHIFHADAALPDYYVHLGVLVVWILIIVLLPLLPFSVNLMELKRKSMLTFGRMAADYSRAFENRWLILQKSDNERLASSGDIQGLSNLIHVYKGLESMRSVPITRSDIISLVIMTLLPVLPLVLTMMPLEEIIKMLTGLLF
jgi:hypothetical protein